MEMDIFSGVHSLFLSWIVTGFNILAIYFQVKETRLRLQEQALSRMGLAVQVVVFILLAFSWIGRVEFPYPDGGFPWTYMSTWYELVGWATVDNGIFAMGQAILLWIVSRQEAFNSGVVHGETEPLLRA
jgi:hypothetical protein